MGRKILKLDAGDGLAVTGELESVVFRTANSIG